MPQGSVFSPDLFYTFPFGDIVRKYDLCDMFYVNDNCLGQSEMKLR